LLAHGDVKPPDRAQFAASDKQKVIREVVKFDWLIMISHTVQLNALVVVDVQVLALSSSEHSLILHEANISHFVFWLKLTQ
jgi:hypothetical protein